MSSKSKRLGSLAEVFKSELLDGTIRKIRLERIRPAEKQPRQDRKKGIEELARSMEKDGLLQPIVVSRMEGMEDNYRIIAGERRYHAAKLLGWTEIECKIFDRDEKETFKLAIIENLQRENLSVYEEVDALLHLKKEYHFTDQELAEMFGKSRSYMTEILSISQLSPKGLQECKNLSIENKNLLVQAAQAEKKGILQEFLQSYKNGEVKTVKDAKEFNKKSTQPTPINTPLPIVNIETNVQIQKKGNTILIQCESPNTLQEIYKFLKKELSRRYTIR